MFVKHYLNNVDQQVHIRVNFQVHQQQHLEKNKDFIIENKTKHRILFVIYMIMLIYVHLQIFFLIVDI